MVIPDPQSTGRELVKRKERVKKEKVRKVKKARARKVKEKLVFVQLSIRKSN